MKNQLVVLMAALAVAPAPLGAQEAKVEPAAPPAAEAQPQSAAAKVEAIVRGLYVEGRVGGGYMVKNAALTVDRNTYPDAPANEPLGPGSTVQMAVGFDLTDFLAVQAVGGAFMVSDTTTLEPVRDLGMVFGGAGVRGGTGLSDRLHVNGSAAIAYVSTDNQVEKTDAGMAVLVGAGVEYYVHVRHFSVGLELSAFVPLSPMRAFVGVAPQIKYTF
jgi:hypothetical protein